MLAIQKAWAYMYPEKDTTPTPDFIVYMCQLNRLEILKPVTRRMLNDGKETGVIARQLKVEPAWVRKVRRGQKG